MATAAVTNTFTVATPAVASQVNQNFTDLVTFLNSSVVHKDGTVAMTALLTLHAADATTDNQAVRKSQMDAKASSVSLAVVPIGFTVLYPNTSAPVAGTATFLECDGTAVSRTTYATLWALKSGAAPFGPGNGTTTFNLPTLTPPANHCYIIRAL